MVRLATCLVIVLSFAGCAARGTESAKPLPTSHAPREPQFANDGDRMVACIELRDHIVQLYADENEPPDGVTMSPEERAAYREGWADELQRRGTFERFARACLVGLTPRKFRCGMAATTTDRLAACMKLAQR
jgi:hypothetical protein